MINNSYSQNTNFSITNNVFTCNKSTSTYRIDRDCTIILSKLKKWWAPHFAAVMIITKHNFTNFVIRLRRETSKTSRERSRSIIWVWGIAIVKVLRVRIDVVLYIMNFMRWNLEEPLVLFLHLPPQCSQAHHLQSAHSSTSSA